MLLVCFLKLPHRVGKLKGRINFKLVSQKNYSIEVSKPDDVINSLRNVVNKMYNLPDFLSLTKKK